MQSYVRSDSVVSRVIAGETLIIPVRKGVGDLASIYSLNQVASSIWRAIAGPRSKEEIVQVIDREFSSGDREQSTASSAWRYTRNSLTNARQSMQLWRLRAVVRWNASIATTILPWATWLPGTAN